MSSSAPLPVPEGPGSVAGAPNLPLGFADAFASRCVDTGELRLHAVIGGDGPPLLLVHVAEALRAVADDVQSVVIPGAGHFVAEEAPEEMLTALTAFLASPRDGSAAEQDPRPHAVTASSR